ncbi:jg1581 [Pararge aegeria aegeria]|uniref:Jg1581 protein n=1 Tax=Pararge aegeria aegeria TaxID=348720 RepID=A0A8S4QF27_9NEOP|nr:jg1581 [Pararge aegeria aegeria]
MPSDAKKRAQQKKKDQANNRNKKPVERVTNSETNGATNGTGKEDRELTAEGNWLVNRYICFTYKAITKKNNSLSY